MGKFIKKKTVYGLILPVLLMLGVNLNGQDTSLGFRITGASVTEKDTFVVSINSDSLLTGRLVYSYKFYITYSPTYFQFVGIDGLGEVLDPWGEPTLRNTNPGTLILSGAGAESLAGSGKMLDLKFIALRPVSTYISFNSSESYLNERNPLSHYINGYISVASRSFPNIYPDERSMFIGDEVQMSVSGGVGPFIYAVENTQVAVISEETKVKAVGPGTTRIMVADSRGDVSYTTGVFDVRSVKMILEEVSAWPGDTFYIPVKLEIFPGTSVYSGRFEMTHDGGLAGLTGQIIPGDFEVSIQNKAISGKTTVSFATSSGLTGNGILCYLGFRAVSSGSRWMRFENMRFNEVMQAWPSKSTYYIQVNSLPNLSFSPNSGTLLWGDMVKINVYNGTAPYTYTVSDTSMASIDTQGWLTAKTGGEVTVTATDFHGATKTTGIFRINDHLVSISPTDGILDVETRVPIVTNSLSPGKTLFGFEGKVSFDSNNLTFKRVDPANSSMLIHSSVSGNVIEFAGASGEGVTSGLVGFIVFQVKSSLSIGSTAYINFSSFAGNEGNLLTGFQNGNIRRVEQVSYRPIALPGRDFSIFEGTEGTLDGSSSYDLDGDSLRFTWIVPDAFILDDLTSQNPVFTAPFVTQNTVYTIGLVVNDGEADSDTAQLKVTVLQVNGPPVADAGDNTSYAEGSSVILNGSNSFDPDGDALSFKWTSLDGIVLFNTTGKKPSFILPQVSVNTTYRFKLVVNDGVVNSQPDTVRITALQVNKKPVAFAGGDFSIEESTEGRLDGSLSYDADNDPITYLWIPPAGISLSSLTDPRPTFTAPPVLRDSAIIFQLVVNDGTKNSDPDKVRVSIINVDILSQRTMVEDVILAGMDSSSIDTIHFSVELYLPYGSDVRALAPAFVLSPGASISPASGSTQNFTTPVYYKLTAEDGITSRLWMVEVNAPEKIVSRQLNSGWNWVSLNVQPENNKITNLFSALSLANLDYIKSSSYSSTWYTTTGWFGNLISFPQSRMIQFKKTVGEGLSVTGKEINPTMTPISMVPGWNSLAYLLRSGTSINSAFQLTSIPPGNVILKGKDGSSVYYAGSGWTGEIGSLNVLEGYKLYVQSAGNLYYNTSGTGKKTASNVQDGRRKLLEEYDLSPGNYEHSATLIAWLNSDKFEHTEPSTHLLAYQGKELRGATQMSYIPELGRNVFILSYYSNDDGVEIEFRVKSPDGEFDTDLILSFLQDNITGEPMEPFEILIKGTGTVNEPASKGNIFIYPNPVKDELFIVSGSEIRKLRILSITGGIVLERDSYARNIRLALNNLSPGIYTLEVETSDEVMMKKIIKTSY